MIARWKWWIWAAVMGGWFAVLEVPAIKNAYDGDTLSEYVWVSPIRWVILAGLIWLVAHFWTKGKV